MNWNLNTIISDHIPTYKTARRWLRLYDGTNPNQMNKTFSVKLKIFFDYQLGTINIDLMVFWNKIRLVNCYILS